MKKYQFEELTLSLSIIITLLAYNFKIDWLFWMFLVKSIIDFYMAFVEAYKEILRERKEKQSEE